MATNTRHKISLTHRFLETLRPEETAFRIPDARCAGLAVRVAPSGAITFDLAFRIAKSKAYRRLSLGKFPDITLDAARDRANELTRAARGGVDLLSADAQAKQAIEAKIKVAALLDDYVTRRIRGRLRTSAEIERRLRRALDPLLTWPADDVRRRDLRRLLDEVADAGHMREVDQRRVCLRRFFGWALAQDHITSDPAVGLQSYERNAPRNRVLSRDEIKTFWEWLGGSHVRDDAADALRLQLSLGARASEVGGIRAEEVEPVTWLWTLPAERSKNKRPRTTPLIGMARDIVATHLALRGAGPLFTTATGLPINSMNLGITLRDHRPPIAHFTTHDLRRTAATMMAEVLELPLETIARVIGHSAAAASTRTLVAHYVKSEFVEQKRVALSAWDKLLRSIIAGEEVPASNVIAIADAQRAVG